jgi:hypothetical protein
MDALAASSTTQPSYVIQMLKIAGGTACAHDQSPWQLQPVNMLSSCCAGEYIKP